MNKLFSKLTMMAVLLMVSGMASAIETFEVGGIYYYSRNGETCVVVKNNIDAYAHYSDDIVIPSSVTHNDKSYSVVGIGDWAFEECTKLTSVSIPNSVTSIGNGAFIGCSSLTSVSLPSSVTTIGDDAFQKSGLTSIVIPNSVESLGQLAFYECSALESVTLPNKITKIEKWDFMDCISLKSITIPASVTTIESGAFTRCISLESIKVESGNTAYDSREDCNAIIEKARNILMYGCQNSVIPNTVTKIGNGAFNSQIKLTAITIPSSVTTIEASAFYGCTGLTSIDIPGSVTYIGMQAFEGCTNATSLTLHEGLKTIESSAFISCKKITSIVIPSSVTSIGSSILGGCSALTSIKVESGNTVYDSRDNCNALIETATNTLMRGCQNSIPNSVTTIDEFAFVEAGITAIDIPSSVTDIKCDAFRNCQNLTSVTIPNTVTHIGENAFLYCKNLKSIVIPANAQYIEEYALYGCESLTSITFLRSEMPLFGNQVFSYEPEKITVHIVPGSKADYQTYLDYWEYTNITLVEDAPAGIEEIENGKLKIENSAVYGINGQHLDAVPQKGVYIKGGKKYTK